MGAITPDSVILETLENILVKVFVNLLK